MVVETATKLVSGKTLNRSQVSKSSRAATGGNSGVATATGSGQVATKKEFSDFTTRLTETLAQELAAIKDTMTVQEKSFRSYVDSLKGSIVTSNSRPIPQTNNSGNAGATGNRYNCFYCGKDGHGWAFCPAKEEDIQAGRIIMDGNRVFFGDKTPVPRGEGPIRRRVMEKYGSSEAAASNNVYQLPLELPPGMLEMPQLDSEHSIFVNQIRDHRDEQLEKQNQLMLAKEAELKALKKSMGVLETAFAKMWDNNAAPSRTIAVQQSPVRKSNSTLEQLAELSRQINGLQAQLAKSNEAEAQYVETRAAKQPSGF